jgi:putative transcriptional regulator
MTKGESQHKLTQSAGYLDGQFLLAMPAMNDPRFNRALIYICAHSSDGAMGIVVNQFSPNITFAKLLEQLDIKLPPPTTGFSLPLDCMAVYFGGPVEQGRGFVLHTADYYAAESTLSIDNAVSLTATIDILRAIASGSGPMKALLALGYAGWAPGQLEDEIQANGWLTCPSDTDLLFDSNIEEKYDRALAKLGVHPSFLVSDVGHA